MKRGGRLAGALLLLATPGWGAGPGPPPGPVLRVEAFPLAQPSEVIAVLTAGCAGCAWGEEGHEAAVLVLSVDGRYSQHLFLVKGAGPAEYRVLLGLLPPGTHRLTVALDAAASAREIRRAAVEGVSFLASSEGAPDHAALARAPFLYARENTIGRFTDLPLLMWYETEPTPGGTRIRYSVVFSNEDGGTPADRLMATWGRVTDIEFVYGVEIDGAGRVREESFQGPEHEMLPFKGSHEDGHPRMWVVTDNNMVSDHGRTAQRYAPAPFPFPLPGVSREAVMDAHPWTYRVMIEEVSREGKVADGARAGSGKIPDPRRFAYLEACGEVEDATLAFALGVDGPEGRALWPESDGGNPRFRIARSGCFRGAVALPAGLLPAALKVLRFRAFTRPPREGEAPLPPGAGRARLTRVNKLFLLGEDGAPGPSLFAWTGEAWLRPEGPPLELVIGAGKP